MIISPVHDSAAPISNYWDTLETDSSDDESLSVVDTIPARNCRSVTFPKLLTLFTVNLRMNGLSMGLPVQGINVDTNPITNSWRHHHRQATLLRYAGDQEAILLECFSEDRPSILKSLAGTKISGLVDGRIQRRYDQRHALTQVGNRLGLPEEMIRYIICFYLVLLIIYHKLHIAV